MNTQRPVFIYFIVTDNSPAVDIAINQIYPNCHHIMFRKHRICNVIKRRMRFEIVQILVRLMFSRNVEAVQYYLSFIEASDGTFY